MPATSTKTKTATKTPELTTLAALTVVERELAEEHRTSGQMLTEIRQDIFREALSEADDLISGLDADCAEFSRWFEAIYAS